MSNPRSPLDVASEEFADKLTELLQGCITDAPEFGVVEAHRDKRQRKIGPQPFNHDAGGFSFVPLPRSCDGGNPATLMLKIEFQAYLAEKTGSLSIRHSTCGVWLRPDPRHRPRPVFRVEYNRNIRTKSPAHVHLHAESLEFGWIYGSAGLPLPRLHKVHFPVGGKRFRPTIEDIFRFLHNEQLYTEWRPGWKQVIDESSHAWEQTQVKSTIRRHLDTTVNLLTELGYEITPPST